MSERDLKGDAKADAKDVAAAAVKGAATGGAVGALRGAAIAGARSKTGQRIIIGILAFGLVVALAIPASIIAIVYGVSASANTGDDYRSSVAVEESGFDQDAISADRSEAARYGIIWQVYVAVKETQKTGFDPEKLAKILRDAELSSLAVAGVYKAGEGMVLGQTDDLKEAAADEQKRYLNALIEYGLTNAQASGAYAKALKWKLGQLNGGGQCKADTLNSTEESESSGTTVITDSEGTEYPLAAAQITNVKDIIAEGEALLSTGEVWGAVAPVDQEKAAQDVLTIMLMAAYAESSYWRYANSSVPESLDYPHDQVGSDHDSVGFWQMRPHWGPSTKDLMETKYQVSAIVGGPNGPNNGSPRGILDVHDWQTRPKGEVAQTVEVSAHPERYQVYEGLAVELLNRYGNGLSCDSGQAIANTGGHPLGDPNIPVTSGYGPRPPSATGGIGSTFHQGLDWGASCGTPIYAIADGKVTQSGMNGGWGNSVTIDHGGGLVSLSAHMPFGANWPSPGTEVKMGEQIGEVGKTGNSYGCHLHLETIVNGARTDPYVVLTQMGVKINFPGKG